WNVMTSSLMMNFTSLRTVSGASMPPATALVTVQVPWSFFVSSLASARARAAGTQARTIVVRTHRRSMWNLAVIWHGTSGPGHAAAGRPGPGEWGEETLQAPSRLERIRPGPRGPVKDLPAGAAARMETARGAVTPRAVRAASSFRPLSGALRR